MKTFENFLTEWHIPDISTIWQTIIKRNIIEDIIKNWDEDDFSITNIPYTDPYTKEPDTFIIEFNKSIPEAGIFIRQDGANIIFLNPLSKKNILGALTISVLLFVWKGRLLKQMNVFSKIFKFSSRSLWLKLLMEESSL